MRAELKDPFWERAQTDAEVIATELVWQATMMEHAAKTIRREFPPQTNIKVLIAKIARSQEEATAMAALAREAGRALVKAVVMTAIAQTPKSKEHLERLISSMIKLARPLNIIELELLEYMGRTLQ